MLLGQKIQINPNIDQNYNQDSTGFTVFASYPLRKFSFARLGLTYGFSRHQHHRFQHGLHRSFRSLAISNRSPGLPRSTGIVSSTSTRRLPTTPSIIP